jgi:hypothetical protein
MNGKCNIPAPRLLLTGDPGTGKTYVIETVCELAIILEIGTVSTCSYNGIAAVTVDGSTICSLFSINDTRVSGSKCKLDDTSVLQLCQKLDADHICCLIVDEISTIDTHIIALLHFCLQQIMDNYNLPFGGLPILFVGDFNQLGPVQKTFIPTDMMTWALHCAHKQPTSSKPATTDNKCTTHSPSHWKASLSHIIKVFQSLVASDNGTAAWQQKCHETDSNWMNPASLPYCGCTSFQNFERFHLYEQMQASEDSCHNSFDQKLSSGHPIDLSDICQ